MSTNKTGKKGARYTAEFKQEATRLVATSGRPLASIARELGVSDQTLSTWCYHARIAREQPGPEGETLEQQVKRLERENRELRLESEILKKAIGYVSTTHVAKTPRT